MRHIFFYGTVRQREQRDSHQLAPAAPRHWAPALWRACCATWAPTPALRWQARAALRLAATSRWPALERQLDELEAV